jgi:hypothetical protein
MKTSQVKPGVEATYNLAHEGGDGKVRVVVRYLKYAAGERGGHPREQTWAVVDGDGRYYCVRPRQLQSL